MTKLEKDLLETLNDTFRLAILMRSTSMPFKAEFVPVEQMDEFIAKGYVLATHDTVKMQHPDHQWQTVTVPVELAERYLEMGYQAVPK